MVDATGAIDAHGEAFRRAARRGSRARQIPPGDTISEVGFNVIPSDPWEVGQTIDVCAVLENFGSSGQQSEEYPVRLNGSRIGTVQTFVPAGETVSACLSTPVPDTTFLEVEVVGIPGVISGDVLSGDGGNGGNGGGNGDITEISTDTIFPTGESITPSSVLPDQQAEVSWDFTNQSGAPDSEVAVEYRLFVGNSLVAQRGTTGNQSLPTSTGELVTPSSDGIPAGIHNVVLEYGVAPIGNNPITFASVNFGTLTVESVGNGDGGNGGDGGGNGDQQPPPDDGLVDTFGPALPLLVVLVIIIFLARRSS